MDLISIVYSFIMMTGTGMFVIHDATRVAGNAVEVDVQTMGLKPHEQRYILLIDGDAIVQHVRVPLHEVECKNPH